MKALAISLIMMFCGLFMFADNSATCKISGGNNSSVVVILGDYDNDKKVQTVIITNDDPENAVNVTFTIKDDYGNKMERTALVVPWQTKTEKVSLPHVATSVTVSGARCSK